MKKFKNQEELMNAFFEGETEGKAGKTCIEGDIIIHDSFRNPLTPAIRRIIVDGRAKYICSYSFCGISYKKRREITNQAKSGGVCVFREYGSTDITSILKADGNSLVTYGYSIYNFLCNKDRVKTFSLKKILTWTCRERDFDINRKKAESHLDDIRTVQELLKGVIENINKINEFNALAEGFGVSVNSPQYWATINLEAKCLEHISFIVSLRHEIESLRLRTKKDTCEAILDGIDKLATFGAMYKIIAGNRRV